MKNLKSLLVLGFLIIICSAEDVSAFYVGIGTGVESNLKGYENRSLRYPIHLEIGGAYGALPFSYSYRDSAHLFSARPRIHYFITPFKDFSKLTVAPGAGASIHYTYTKIDGTVSKNAQVGLNLSGHARYQFNELISLQFVPALLDLNVYEVGGEVDSANGTSIGGVGSNFTISYSTMIMLEFNF